MHGVPGGQKEMATPPPFALDVSVLAYETVPPHLGLNSNLVSPARAQPHFEKRSMLERLEHAVIADRLDPPRIACVRLFLNERFRVPDEVISPGALRRFYPAMHDGVVDAFRFPALELILQGALCDRILGEHHQSRGILVDAMDDVRPALAMGLEAVGDQVVDRRHRALALERHRQQARGLVDDEKHVVFIDDVEPTAIRGRWGRLAVPGRSPQNPMTSPAKMRVPASPMPTSDPLTDTRPRSRLVFAR